jgi:hypothetical protein
MCCGWRYRYHPTQGPPWLRTSLLAVPGALFGHGQGTPPAPPGPVGGRARPGGGAHHARNAILRFCVSWGGYLLKDVATARPPKNTGGVLLLAAEARTATHQLPSCCRSRSRPSRRQQSMTRLTQQSRSTGRRRRRGAAGCAQKAPPCAPCARTRGRSRRAPRAAAKQSRRFYRVRRGWGCADGRETTVVLFAFVSLPGAVAPPRPPRPPSPCLLSIFSIF